MKKILIIEDDENNLLLITRLMVDAGYDVISARTGLAGLNLAVAEQPDAVLLDIFLPDISGGEVAEKMKAIPQDRLIPIIAMTSLAMSGDREKLLALGCTGYIEKPYDPETVVAEIKTFLGDDT